MTELPNPTTRRPVPGQLTFTAPRRGKPPAHLADLVQPRSRNNIQTVQEPLTVNGEVEIANR